MHTAGDTQFNLKINSCPLIRMDNIIPLEKTVTSADTMNFATAINDVSIY